MSHFGDLEAHRRVLEEVRSSESAKLFMACLRAVAMSAFGSFHGLDTVDAALSSHRRQEEVAHLRATLAVASVTASFSQGMPDLSDELSDCEATLEGELSRITYAREQATTTAVTQSVAVPLGFALSTVQIGGTSPAVANGGAATVRELWAQLDAQYELTVYMQAYLQFIRGFLVLWDELFGHHYTFPSDVVQTGIASSTSPPQSKNGGEPQRGGDAHCDADVLSSVLLPNCCPPHLYAVNWKCVLTPARREWIEDQHEVTRELFVRIMARELPLEGYLVYQLYATMSLRLRLLEAVAQLFVWSSCYMDVMVCVQQLYTNYRLQCEMARLQDLWASFQLFDADFLRECEVFNSSCSEDQGAVIEHMFFDASKLSAAKAGVVDGEGQGAGPSTAAARVGESGSVGVPLGVSEEFQASSGDDSASVGSSRSAGAETSTSAATDGRVAGTKREIYTPLFPTRCHFTWLLQRACWSMYGRSSLLFSSCLHAERVYDGTPLLRPPPTIAELSLGAVSRPQSHHNSRLDMSRSAPAAAKLKTTFSGLTTALRHSSTGASAAATNLRLQPFVESPSPSQLRRHGLSPAAGSPSANTTAVGHSPSAHPLPTATTSDIAVRAATDSLRRSPSAAPPGVSQATSHGHSQSSRQQANQEYRSTSRASHTGWRGVLQSFLYPEQSRSHGRPAESGALPRVAASVSAARNTPSPLAVSELPSHIRDAATAVATSSGAAAHLCDSRSKPVDGLPPFFFHYAQNSTGLDDATSVGTDRGTESRAAAVDGGTDEVSSGACADGLSAAEEARPSIDYIFLKRCGCYVLALAIRKALESQRYPATLVVVTDNSTREGRVHWRDNRIIPLAAKDDPTARSGIAPWVLNFVYPGSRLASDAVVREQQERRLFQTIVFHVAGADSPRVCFPAYNSLFFALNSGPLFDSGRLHFVMHLSMPESEAYEHHYGRHRVTDEVRDAAYAGLEEIFKGWAMNCSCNEALRLLASIGSLSGQRA